MSLEYTDARFNRNLGFMSAAEQQSLNDAHIMVGGAGGDGGLLAITLARMGVGELTLADPETFDVENINRQAACTSETVGMNKAEAVGKYINAINPDIVTHVYTEGVTTDNVEEMVSKATMVIDEVEYTVPQIGVSIARNARKFGKPVLSAFNVGFGTFITSYSPSGKTYEEFMGLDPTAPLEQIAESEIDIDRWLGHVPSYADYEVFKRVAKGEVSAPSVSPGVLIAAGRAATEVLCHLSPEARRAKPIYAPKGLYMDAFDGTKIIKNTKNGFKASVLKMILNNKLNRVVQTEY